MPDLETLLASGPDLQWIEAQVVRSNGDYVTLAYRGGEIDNVAYLDTYTPTVNDIVQVLSQSGRGMLIIGRAKKTGTGMSPLPTPTTSTVTADGIATLHVTETSSAWETGVFSATGPTDYGVWLYDTGLLTGVGKDMLTLFEIQVNMSGGGPAEFFLHNQAGAAGTLAVLSPNRYTTAWEPLGALTWVPLPLGWGEELVAGRARGIGAGGGLFAASWIAGGGSLRFSGV